MIRKTSVALVSILVSASCSRNEAPSEAVRTPASVSSEAPPKGAPADEKVGSPRTNIADMDFAAADKALQDASKELGDALALATPDCAVLRPLRDRICELAEHICRLAGTDSDIKARCEDGRGRCDSAKSRVGSQCP